MKMRKKLLIPAFIIGVLVIGAVSGAFLAYKAFVEIYGTKYPLGIVELETWGLEPIEGLEAGEQHIGEMCVWTYSNNTELVVQLMQLSHVVTNFRSFTVKVCLPLDAIFVVDVTASMEPYIDIVKEELKELMWVLVSMQKAHVQVGVVAFKDIPGETTWEPLTDDYGAVESFIDGLTAAGGDPIPQSHYLGFEQALDLFHDKEGSLAHDKIVVFVSDAEAGYNDLPDWPGRAAAAAWDLATEGVKIHSVLCGPEEEPEYSQLKYYSDISVGNFIRSPERIVPGVTRDPTWIVKLTPITPFDSFRMKLNSSTPTMQEGYYNFSIFVDYFCKAVPWHEFFVVELGAYLEHAEIPPYLPPPPPEEPGPEETGIEISLGVFPAVVDAGSSTDITYEIDPGLTTAIGVELYVYDPGDTPYLLYTDTDLGSHTEPFTVPIAGPEGTWEAEVTYIYQYLGYTLTAQASADFVVEIPD